MLQHRLAHHRVEGALDAAAIAARALDAGLVINVPAPGTLRCLPPLIIGEAASTRRWRFSVSA